MGRIDAHRLTVEWATIVLVVIGLLFLLRSQAGSPERPKDHSSGSPSATNKASKSVALHSGTNASAEPDPKPPHWALSLLADSDLEQLLPDLRWEGLLEGMSDDFYPVVSVLVDPSQAPNWLPEKVEGRALSPSEQLHWFDELLKHYSASSTSWPPTGDKNSKTKIVLLSLYRMYQDRVRDMLPPPSFIPARSGP